MSLDAELNALALGNRMQGHEVWQDVMEHVFHENAVAHFGTGRSSSLKARNSAVVMGSLSK
jgi:hypothetical protein